MANPNLEIAESTGSTNPAISSRAYVTFEEYLERSSDTHVCEWVDGEIIEMPGASFEHQNIGGFLEKVLGFFVENNDLGIVLRSPFAMKLEEQRRGREPDIIFVGKRKMDRVLPTYLDGPCDIAVEIISPESIARDRADKFVEYEAAGINEYWLIDPDRKIAEFYGLTSEGRYRLLPTDDGTFTSEVLPGFFLRLEWLWERNPSSINALRQLKQIL